jgi:hypothetical protein
VHTEQLADTMNAYNMHCNLDVTLCVGFAATAQFTAHTRQSQRTLVVCVNDIERMLKHLVLKVYTIVVIN